VRFRQAENKRSWGYPGQGTGRKGKDFHLDQGKFILIFIFREKKYFQEIRKLMKDFCSF